jgi:NADH:ubiquinone oxidoreductase subunit K
VTLLALSAAAALFTIGAWTISRRRDLLVIAGGVWAMTAGGFLAFVAATPAGGAASSSTASATAMLVIAGGQPIVLLAVAFAHHRIRRSIRTRNTEALKG